MEEKFFDKVFNELRRLNADGQQWFNLSDICKLLGLSNIDASINDFTKTISERDSKSMQIRLFDTEVKHTNIFRDGTSKEVSQTVSMRYANVPALHFILLRSQKSEAQALRHYIFDTIVPAMRRIGFEESVKAINNELKNLDKQISKLEEENKFLYNSNQVGLGIALASAREKTAKEIEEYLVLTSSATVTEKKRIIEDDPTEVDYDLDMLTYVNNYKDQHNIPYRNNIAW